jgi:Putative Actinobacterial Holin-X, holin superfamily III
MTETMSTLVRDEIQLAQAQFAEKGKSLGAAVAMFATAGVFALFGLGWLLHAGYLALALVLPGWAAALIVAGFVLLVAAIAALVGKKFKDAAPSPETKQNLQRDIDAFKAGVSS